MLNVPAPELTDLKPSTSPPKRASLQGRLFFACCNNILVPVFGEGAPTSSLLGHYIPQEIIPDAPPIPDNVGSSFLFER